MSLSRRDFIKQAAAVSAAGAIGMQVSPEALAAAQEAEKATIRQAFETCGL